MITYIIRRLIQALVVLFLTISIVFLIMRLLPGDPVLMYISESQYSMDSPEQIAQVRHEFGLDKPLYTQYGVWILNLFRGDLGSSLIKHQPVKRIIADAFPRTLHLGIVSFLISTIIGLTIGVICGVKRGKPIDTILTILANIGITMPIFWVGIMLIYVFGLWLHWLPTHGYTPPFPIENFWASTRQAILPVFCLSLFPMAALVRQTRSAMLEVIKQNYIQTAWSKGLNERIVVFRHALKNGILPVVTLLGIQLGLIIGGSVIIEMVFAIPGMGKLSVDALLNRDYAIVQGVILLIGTFIVLINLVVDISYGWLDPRVNYQ
jgi:peptide/nickel transport system permease protein